MLFFFCESPTCQTHTLRHVRDGTCSQTTQDGTCFYHARYNVEDLLPPSGTWRTYCWEVGQGWVNADVTMTAVSWLAERVTTGEQGIEGWVEDEDSRYVRSFFLQQKEPSIGMANSTQRWPKQPTCDGLHRLVTSV